MKRRSPAAIWWQCLAIVAAPCIVATVILIAIIAAGSHR